MDTDLGQESDFCKEKSTQQEMKQDAENSAMIHVGRNGLTLGLWRRAEKPQHACEVTDPRPMR